MIPVFNDNSCVTVGVPSAPYAKFQLNVTRGTVSRVQKTYVCIHENIIKIRCAYCARLVALQFTARGGCFFANLRLQ